jgi:hypothetical protein
VFVQELLVWGFRGPTRKVLEVVEEGGDKYDLALREMRGSGLLLPRVGIKCEAGDVQGIDSNCVQTKAVIGDSMLLCGTISLVHERQTRLWGLLSH